MKTTKNRAGRKAIQIMIAVVLLVLSGCAAPMQETPVKKGQKIRVISQDGLLLQVNILEEDMK